MRPRAICVARSLTGLPSSWRDQETLPAFLERLLRVLAELEPEDAEDGAPADETADVGIDLATPVVEDIEAKVAEWHKNAEAKAANAVAAAEATDLVEGLLRRGGDLDPPAVGEDVSAGEARVAGHGAGRAQADG